MSSESESSILGEVQFAVGGTLELTDDNVAANSLSVTMSTCRTNKFNFGTFNAAMLKIGIIDEAALAHDFAGARIEITAAYTDEQGQESDALTGIYWVDGTTIKRNKNVVTMTAQDASGAFNRAIPDNVRSTSYIPADLYEAACTACGVTEGTFDPTDFPNSSVTFTLANAAIQTWRDAVMWACQLQCCNAIIDRDGEFILRSAKYESSTADHDITAAHRADIKFSDTRTYLKYMDAYSGGKLKSYVSTRVISDEQARAGKISLAFNPLLDGKTEAACDTINNNILYFMGNFLQRQIEAKMFDRPDIALGQLMRFRGGKVDVRRSVLGVATHIVWRHHGYTTVTCTAPEAVTEDDEVTP